MSPENLSTSQLKTALKKLGAKYEDDSKALLYYLREKLKAQGKRSEGFGAWVEANLPISRRTADRWADEYAVKAGKKKPSTSGQHVQKWVPGPVKDDNDDDLYLLELPLVGAERRAFDEAARVLQREKRLTQVIYEAVLVAANVKKPNAKEKNTRDSGMANGSSSASPRSRASGS